MKGIQLGAFECEERRRGKEERKKGGGKGGRGRKKGEAKKKKKKGRKKPQNPGPPGGGHHRLVLHMDASFALPINLTVKKNVPRLFPFKMAQFSLDQSRSQAFPLPLLIFGRQKRKKKQDY